MRNFNNSYKLLTGVLALVLVAGMTSPAFADSVTWTGDGVGNSWETANNWNPIGVPNQNDDVTLTGPAVSINSDVTIGIDGSLTLNIGSDITIQPGNTMTNKGTINFTFGQADIFTKDSTFVNDCTGFIDFQDDGMIWVPGFSATTFGTLINHGTMIGNLPGGSDRFDNHLVLRPDGLIQFSTPLASVSEEGGTLEEISSICDKPIGGTVGSMSTTSLLVAGAQANMGLWSLALVGIVGAGAAITYKLKSKKTEQ